MPQRALRRAIGELDHRIARIVAQRLGQAVYDPRTAKRLVATFRDLNARLAHNRYLLGDTLTLADVRPWGTLVRYDAGAKRPRGHRAETIGLPAPVAMSRDLYSQPAFCETTDLTAFTAPLSPTFPDWIGVSS